MIKKLDILNIFIILISWFQSIFLWIYSVGDFGELGCFTPMPRIPLINLNRQEMLDWHPYLFIFVAYFGVIDLFIFPTFLIILFLFLKGKLHLNNIRKINMISVLNIFSLLIGLTVYLNSAFKEDYYLQVCLPFVLIFNLLFLGAVLLRFI